MKQNQKLKHNRQLPLSEYHERAIQEEEELFRKERLAERKRFMLRIHQPMKSPSKESDGNLWR